MAGVNITDEIINRLMKGIYQDNGTELMKVKPDFTKLKMMGYTFHDSKHNESETLQTLLLYRILQELKTLNSTGGI